MSRYDFTSPGANAGDAISNFLMQREQQKRQQMLDQLMAQRQQEQADQGREDLLLRRGDLGLRMQREAREAAEGDRDRLDQQALLQQQGREKQADMAGKMIQPGAPMPPGIVASMVGTPQQARFQAGGTLAPVQKTDGGYEEVPTPGATGSFISLKPTADQAFARDVEARRVSEAEKARLAAEAKEKADLEGRKELLKLGASLRPPSGGRDLTPGQRIAQTRQLRNDFVRETAAMRTLDQQLGLMRQSLAAVKSGAPGAPAAGSQGVLVTFQKMLDPISVVRESEYARSGSGLSLLGRLEGKWEQIKSGGAGVTPQDLEAFAALAAQFAQNQRRSAAETKRQIDGIADEYGLNKDHITRDFDDSNAQPEPGGVPQTPGGGETAAERARRIVAEGLK